MVVKDHRGAPLTGADTRALELYETAICQFNCYVGDPLATIDGAIAESPDFAMAIALKAYLLLSGMERAPVAQATELLAKLRSLKLNDRERRHAAAIACLIDGALNRASERLDDILIDDPHDIVALQMGHLLDFFRGDARNLRDRIARVMAEWDSHLPGYHTLLGMHAFGLEEMGDYAKAEDSARRAIQLNRRDGWAYHAVAHVMEMTGRYEEGAAFMRDHESNWAAESFFQVHNWWHLALFRLEADQTADVLKLYDGPIRGGQSSMVLDMVDASALLWRLKLREVDLGNRWEAIADRWQPLIEDKLYAFNDSHAVMALLGAGRVGEAERTVSIMTETARKQSDNALMSRDVGLPLARALLAFEHGKFAATIDLLRPLRNIAQRFGGSHAQRDLIDLTLIEAARRAGETSLVRALANERLALKPKSPLARRYRDQGTKQAA
ncbi:MAG TPA: tetratricopeptide repeat protein [Dongiaceae bacterium]|jgi:tetratricopeptide (TPR) repeat protein|nr:tetratricopeptide repeat protein [Dongiaceae bacterium]